MKRLEAAFDRLDNVATAIYDTVLWILARFSLVAVTRDEVKRGTRPTNGDLQAPEHMRASHAHFYYDRQQDASKHTDDKVKLLLTLSAALNGFLLAFAGTVGERWLLIGVAVALTATIFICLGFMRVRTSGTPVPEDAPEDPEGHGWARDLYIAAQFDARAHEFRVDLYRAARRWFVLAFALALIAAVRSNSQMHLPVDQPSVAHDAPVDPIESDLPPSSSRPILQEH